MERDQEARDMPIRRGVAAMAIGLIVVGGNVLGPDFAAAKTGPAYASKASSGLPVNLLGPGTHWQLGGVTQSASQLEVSNINESLVNQDGSPGQANPPVNLYGTRLNESGGFEVNVGVSNAASASEITFYDAPPLIEDEFRAEPGSLKIRISGNTVNFAETATNGKAIAKQLSQTVRSGLNHDVSVIDSRGRFSFVVDGQAIGQRLPDRDIFKTGTVWFGFNAPNLNTSFTVNKLTANGYDGQVGIFDTRTEQITQSPNGFAALAQKKRPGFLFGAAVALGPMVADPTYDKLLGNDNAVSIENVGKMEETEPLPSVYNFSDMDAIVAMAERAGMQVHGHAIVFGEANPAWVQEIAKNDPAELQQVMVSHITTEVGHYAGKVNSWDIDEPLADYDTPAGQTGLRKDIWYNAMGPSYLVTAIKAINAANPNAEIWLNDFGMESDDNRFAQMVTLIKWLQAQGVNVAGVGFESHIDDGDTNNADTHINVPKLESRFKTLQTMGLKGRISELDVSDTPSEYPVFGDVVTACLDEPDCTGVTTWGITNKYSSGGELNRKGVFVPGTGLPWDKNEQPTPAVGYIRSALNP